MKLTLAILFALCLAGCQSIQPPAPVASNGPAASWPTFWAAAQTAANKETNLLILPPPRVAPMPPVPPGAVATVSAFQPSLLAFSSSSSLPDPVVTASAPFAWDALPNVDGFILHYGSRSGRYDRAVNISNAAANTAVASLADTNGYYFALTSFVLTNATVNCFTNRQGVAVCLTNSIVESDPTPEIFFCTTNLVPFGSVSNGLYLLTGWGNAGKSYQILYGSTVDAANDVADFAGSNSVWTFTNNFGAGFLKTVITANNQ